MSARRRGWPVTLGIVVGLMVLLALVSTYVGPPAWAAQMPYSSFWLVWAVFGIVAGIAGLAVGLAAGAVGLALGLAILLFALVVAAFAMALPLAPVVLVVLLVVWLTRKRTHAPEPAHGGGPR